MPGPEAFARFDGKRVIVAWTKAGRPSSFLSEEQAAKVLGVKVLALLKENPETWVPMGKKKRRHEPYIPSSQPKPTPKD